MAKKDGVELTFSAKNLVSKTIKGIIRGLNKIGQVAKKVGSTTKAAFKGMAKAAAGLAAAMAGPVALSVKFSKSMAEVQTVLDDPSNLNMMSDAVRRLSKEFGYAKEELAKGLYDIRSATAGLSDAEVIKIFEAATKAAVAGVSDVQTAGNAITNVLNAWKISADEVDAVSDKLFATVKNGKTTLTELSNSMANASVSASTAGISLDEVLAATATLTKNGLATGKAMTFLGGAIEKGLAPTDLLKKKFAELGTTSGDFLKNNGLMAFVKQLEEFSGGDKGKIKEFLGASEAARAVWGLMGKNTEDVAANMRAIANASGATDNAYQMLEHTRQWDRLLQNVLGILGLIGETIGNFLNPMLEQANNWMVDIGSNATLLEKVKALVGNIFSERTGEVFKKFGKWLWDSAGTATVAIGGLLGEIFINNAKLLGYGLKYAGKQAINFLAKGLEGSSTGAIELLSELPKILKAGFSIITKKGFWVGAGKIAIGAFGKLGKFLAEIFTAPIDALQAGIQKAMEELFEQMAKIPFMADMLGIGKDFKADSLKDIYSQVKNSDRSASSFLKDTYGDAAKYFDEGKKEIAEATKSEVKDIVASLGTVFKSGFDSAANKKNIFDTTKEVEAMGSALKGIPAILKKHAASVIKLDEATKKAVKTKEAEVKVAAKPQAKADNRTDFEKLGDMSATERKLAMRKTFAGFDNIKGFNPKLGTLNKFTDNAGKITERKSISTAELFDKRYGQDTKRERGTKANPVYVKPVKDEAKISRGGK